VGIGVGSAVGIKLGATSVQVMELPWDCAMAAMKALSWATMWVLALVGPSVKMMANSTRDSIS
jgi:hypothetical protein